MITALLVVASCLVGLLVAIAVIVSLIIIIRSGGLDTVSTARQDWIQRRSDKDEREW
jgi:hypothetical protein